MSKTIIDKNLVVISSHYMDNNTYILFNENEAIVIDPSFSGQDVVNCIPKNTKVIGILLTHAHFDHCFETATILNKWNVPVYIHEADKDTYFKYRYDDLTNMQTIDFSKNINWFNKNKLEIGSFVIDVIHTPGHSGGSVTYIYKNYVFVGDTLFYNSYGRTDLGNSSPIEIVKSLNKLWKKIKPDQLVLPGHSKWGTFKDVQEHNWMVKQIIK